jgi:hypothetical protein
MLKLERLRKADAYMGLLVFAIGIAIIIEAASFPTGTELSGVRNDWYVSPALMPYIIGSGLAAMGVALCLIGVKAAGLKALAVEFRGMILNAGRLAAPGASSVRFLAVVGVIAVSVFLYIPRVDFVLSAALLLVSLMSMFAFDDEVLLRRLLAVFGAASAAAFLYFASGLGATLAEGFYFAPDVVGAVILAAFMVIAAILVGKPRRGAFVKLALLSLAVPFVLVPVFKYLLYIPLPREGGVVALMDIVRYDILDPIQE